MKKIIKIFIFIFILVFMIILLHITKCYIIINKIKYAGTEYINSLSNYYVISTSEFGNQEKEVSEYYFKDDICLVKSNYETEEGVSNIVSWENKNTNEKVCFNIDTQKDYSVNEISLPIGTIVGNWYNHIFSFIKKENGYYVITYINSGNIARLYYNINTGIVEKHEGNVGDLNYITTWKIEKDCVTDEDIKRPEK